MRAGRGSAISATFPLHLHALAGLSIADAPRADPMINHGRSQGRLRMLGGRLEDIAFALHQVVPIALTVGVSTHVGIATILGEAPVRAGMIVDENAREALVQGQWEWHDRRRLIQQIVHVRRVPMGRIHIFNSTVRRQPGRPPYVDLERIQRDGYRSVVHG